MFLGLKSDESLHCGCCHAEEDLKGYCSSLKNKILTQFTHPHVIPTLYDLLSSAEHEERYFSFLMFQLVLPTCSHDENVPVGTFPQHVKYVPIIHITIAVGREHILSRVCWGRGLMLQAGAMVGDFWGTFSSWDQVGIYTQVFFFSFSFYCACVCVCVCGGMIWDCRDSLHFITVSKKKNNKRSPV